MQNSGSELTWDNQVGLLLEESIWRNFSHPNTTPVIILILVEHIAVVLQLADSQPVLTFNGRRFTVTSLAQKVSTTFAEIITQMENEFLRTITVALCKYAYCHLRRFNSCNFTVRGITFIFVCLW